MSDINLTDLFLTGMTSYGLIVPGNKTGCFDETSGVCWRYRGLLCHHPYP